MKVIIFSDSHGKTNLMHEVLSKESYDMILHLGDCYDDMLELRECYDVPVYGVVGNIDYNDAKSQQSLNLMGHNIFMCHGHRYRVKSSLTFLKTYTASLNSHIVLFGHTHEAYHEKGACVFMNPGSISKPKGDTMPTYGVLELSENSIQSKIIYMK